MLCSDTTWVNPVISPSWKVPQFSALPYKDLFMQQWCDSPPPFLGGGIRVFESPSDLTHSAPIGPLLLIKLLIQFGPLFHEGGQTSGTGLTESLWCETLWRTLLPVSLPGSGFIQAMFITETVWWRNRWIGRKHNAVLNMGHEGHQIHIIEMNEWLPFVCAGVCVF